MVLVQSLDFKTWTGKKDGTTVLSIVRSQNSLKVHCQRLFELNPRRDWKASSSAHIRLLNS